MNQPSGLLWKHRPEEIGVDHWTDLIALSGTVAALLVTLGQSYSPLLALCWLLYLSLMVIGQTFLSFQWDILLLEVGGLAILYAPLSPFTLNAKPTRVVELAMHWCLFKLMLMSGVVKLHSRCPTWLGLTALHYHYATQCIPTPLAWYAHQLPNAIQKLSVAGTFVIEIPATLLILLPWKQARTLFGYLNIFLMIVIMLTGNYTFFNALTVVLSLSLLQSGSWWITLWANALGSGPSCRISTSTPANHSIREDPAMNKNSVLLSDQYKSKIQSPQKTKKQAQETHESCQISAQSELLDSWGQSILGYSVPLMFLGYVTSNMYNFKYNSQGTELCLASGKPLVHCMRDQTLEYGLDVNLNFSIEDLDRWLKIGLMWSVPMFFLRFCLDAWHDLVEAGSVVEKLKPVKLICGAWRLGNAVLMIVLCGAYFFASLAPLSNICPELRTMLPSGVDSLHSTARAWHLVSGYGLFARMTGVGDSAAILPNSGGMKISKVARPELEIQASEDGNKWHSLEFRYKPGNLTRSPPWIGLPGFDGSFSGMHQPRLDWQMWFAALGSYQNNPWLIALVYRLLHGGKEAKRLMAPELWPEGYADGKAPKMIRIMKYEFDFSRHNFTAGAKPSKKWWKRKAVGEYLPPLTADNPSLVGFSQQLGMEVSDKIALGTKAEGLKEGMKIGIEKLRNHDLLFTQAVFVLILAKIVFETVKEARRKSSLPSSQPLRATRGSGAKGSKDD